jgi:hypothetical protein
MGALGVEPDSQRRHEFWLPSSRQLEVGMISARMHSSETVFSLFLVSLFAIVLAANATVPASAGTPGTWANTGSLNTARTDHTATLLPNGQVLVAGGYAGNLSGPIVLSCAELYTP